MSSWCVSESFSTAEQMREVIQRMVHVCRVRLALDEDKIYDLKVVLNELANNALEHGKEPVFLTTGVCCDAKYLHILLSDHGEGFDICSYQTCPDLWEEHGRGLFIVHQLADALSYNDKNNKILVRMKISS